MGPWIPAFAGRTAFIVSLSARLAVALLTVIAGCAPAPPIRHVDVMPVILPTDTLRVEFSRAEFDRPTGVLRLAGQVLVRGPQTAGWTEAGGAQITLRPPDQTDLSSGTPFVPALMRKPYVTLSSGREGGFEFGAVTPDVDGYTMDIQWVGSFGLTLRVDSLVAAPRPPADRP